MGEINQIQKNRSKKKWGREEWIILILAGVFLLIVFMPSFENDKKDNDFEKEQEQVTTRQKDVDTTFSDTHQMESRLEEVLRSIEGIDSVKAMITYKISEEQIALKESSRSKKITTEEDSRGGMREIDEESLEETVCYTGNDDERSSPYITHTVAPKVEGVLVVVSGKNASLLRTQIVKAVQALFNVESHKVVVIKMKES